MNDHKLGINPDGTIGGPDLVPGNPKAVPTVTWLSLFVQLEKQRADTSLQLHRLFALMRQHNERLHVDPLRYIAIVDRVEGLLGGRIPPGKAPTLMNVPVVRDVNVPPDELWAVPQHVPYVARWRFDGNGTLRLLGKVKP